ncbi:Rrf2 family transcriptional regulator [Altererythrobacter salegens]|uniref:Rrf2 family transcriptional regulator n=1 Tax=Croceibacterium salegens TaxID=1737568 RepID=A0A6I4SUA1_9SPHN|nr:Rrf2 family transcriptional regulator [Croceibacterium salegens]MXO58667.1 Rrf2 family transcriptional regulator [Croceibacterium salegens]
MQLSLHTDYALRVLMALAATNRQLSVEDIARRYDISRNHLAKVAQRLQTEGYVETFRGRGGGMRLARPANEIRAGEVVRRFETLDSFVGCFTAGTGCAVNGLCALKPALAGALEAFLVHLDQFTLDELVPDADKFARRLEAVAAA